MLTAKNRKTVCRFPESAFRHFAAPNETRSERGAIVRDEPRTTG